MPDGLPKVVKLLGSATEKGRGSYNSSDQSLRSMTPGHFFVGPLVKPAEYTVGAALCCSNQKDRVA